MQSATESPRPERLYDRLEACASSLAEAALEQATLSLTVVTLEAAAAAQDRSPAELARAGVILSGTAAGGLAQAPADLALNHGGHSSAAEPEACGLAEAEPAGLTHGTEQLWDSAPTAQEAAAGASPGLCAPRSSRAGVLEDRESSCELGRASSGSGAGSPASDAALCRKSGGQRSCDGVARHAAALDCVQPPDDSRSGLSPDPDPGPGSPPVAPRSNGCVAVRGSAAWELSPDRGPRPERRRWLSRSACELGDASSSASGDMEWIGNLNLNLDAAAALPAAQNGLRDSDKENMAAVAAASVLDGSCGGVRSSADGGGLGREAALLASEFAGLGLPLGFEEHTDGGAAPAGGCSPSTASGAWGALRRSSSQTLTDPGSQPPVHGALFEEVSVGGSQARQAAAAGPGAYCSGVALGSVEACGEAKDCVKSRSSAANPAAECGSLPDTGHADAGAAAPPERSANDACSEQHMGRSGSVTAHSERSAGESCRDSAREHGVLLLQALHGRNAAPAMRSDSPGAGAAAAAPPRSACEAHAHTAGAEALPRSLTLQPLPGSGARAEAGGAYSDCGSANGDPDPGFRVVRDGAVPVLSSSSELVPLGHGGGGGGGNRPHAADEPGEVQSAPEAGLRGQGMSPAAKRSLGGSWDVPPTGLVLRCEALSPWPRPP